MRTANPTLKDGTFTGARAAPGAPAMTLRGTATKSIVLLLLAAVTHVRGPRRALALFIIVYAIVASVTETGLGDASPYLLDLAVAASLLASPAHRAAPADRRRSIRR